MPTVSASTLYKKLNGTLAISQDQKSATWTPAQPSNAPPVLVLDVAKITNLQQTPEDKPKVMLRIFVQEPGQTETISHIFTFTSSTEARSEANAIRDGLSTAIAHKSGQNVVSQAAGAGQSAAMTIANAISGGRNSNLWEDDERLVSDVRLQQGLMKENPNLQKTFMEAKGMKPESLSLIQFTKQFWASRVHLLRAYALSQSQNKGMYNVFSEIKRTEGGTSLNLTSEHIKAIFEQYPVMRTVYDEVVPRRIKDERDFWSRFFQSQLYSTLRGMKVDRIRDAKDPLLDTYLDHPELTGARSTSAELHIPKFIDLEGNEENHSQRKGNAPDQELRQTALDKAPIIRRLNALSEKLMATVRPSDVDASAPIGIDEHEYEQLRLRDLAGDPERQRIELNIRDQSRFFSDSLANTEDEEIRRLRALNPTSAIQSVCIDLDQRFNRNNNKGGSFLDIDEGTEDYDDDDDDDDDGETVKPVSGFAIASAHIKSLIQAHRDQTSDSAASTDDSQRHQKASGLSVAIYERLKLTHATTLEFLRQFWNAFLSGDSARVNEIASLVESLNRALDRINSIASDAQAERENRIAELRTQAQELFKKTGKRRRVDESALGGGEKAVRQLLGPVTRSLQTAVEKYRVVYEQQFAELQESEAG